MENLEFKLPSDESEQLLVKSQENARFSLLGFFYIIIFTLCLTFFQITIDKDSYSKDEIKLINQNELYKVPRLLIKISFTFFTGIMLMIPFIFIIYLIPVQTDLTPEIGQFYSDLSNIFQILLRWEILFLIIGSTIFPYLLIFIAYAKWSPYNLTYRQWNCILTIIEPIGGIFFGVIFGVDSFPIEFLAIVLFLLIITLFLRYIHESTNKVNAYLLLSKKKGALKGLSLKILKFSGVFSIHSLIGTHDILVYIRTNSFREFRYLVDEKIRKLEEIKNIKILFINKIIKITS